MSQTAPTRPDEPQGDKHPKCPDGIHATNIREHGWCANCSSFPLEPPAPSGSTGGGLRKMQDEIALRLYRMRYDEIDEAQEIIDEVVQLIEADRRAMMGCLPEKKDLAMFKSEYMITKADGYNTAIDDMQANIRAVGEQQ